MPSACVVQSHAKVGLLSERLVVSASSGETGDTEILREIPIVDLDRLTIEETVAITSPALAELLRRGIPINILGTNGRFLGSFLSAQNDHGQWRLAQYAKTLDSGFALTMAGRIVSAKVYNQRRLIQRLAANRNADASSALDSLERMLSQIARATSIAELRGLEGASTARYFEAWATFLPPEFPFERRSTRPPLNPVNACISYGAVLLYAEAASFLHAHGLDPALGLLHLTEDGRWSLALDLIEPFRPVLVEALALDLFSHQILNAQLFEKRNGGVYLATEGKKKFLLQYERRMERQFLSEAVGCRTTLRAELERQATAYKAALEFPEKFEPFLMN
ncbi:CRISPR-associated endonuclease Cas1 [Methylacidimicrobium cyclopophantes]|uniref:CRISPR-associated endonuclease Cas1 n=1 Tax=Methylacidimicrobium cyclopophantes TaxID=1041766 RepID=A0A5E6MH32_9BACT|nr:CRISPR-associated endonuclease Cas1 [Methylacidimicrobium cyclopophantes]VVM07196.1 CRISPR-associated endonuclease Cas1 [Methylacidimicrobium cyclopophantes]